MGWYQEMIYEKRQPKKINSFIKDVVADYGWNDEYSFNLISKTWDKLFGQTFKGNITLINFRHNVLFIRTNSSSWRVELLLRKEHIIESINNELNNKLISDLNIK